MDCLSSAPTDVVRAVFSFASFAIGIVLPHSIHNFCDKVDRVQQFVLHASPGLDPPQLVQHSGELISERLIHPRISLYHHIPAQEPPGDIVPVW